MDDPDLSTEPVAELADLPPTEDEESGSIRNPSLTPEGEEWVPEFIPEALDGDEDEPVVDLGESHGWYLHEEGR